MIKKGKELNAGKGKMPYSKGGKAIGGMQGATKPSKKRAPQKI